MLNIEFYRGNCTIEEIEEKSNNTNGSNMMIDGKMSKITAISCIRRNVDCEQQINRFDHKL